MEEKLVPSDGCAAYNVFLSQVEYFIKNISPIKHQNIRENNWY